MEFEEGWLKHNIERAAREVESWPLHKQEMFQNKPFTVQEMHDKTKIRIERLREEIAREEENLKQYAEVLGIDKPKDGPKITL